MSRWKLGIAASTAAAVLLAAPAAGADTEPAVSYVEGEDEEWYGAEDEILEPPHEEVDTAYFFPALSPYGKWFWSDDHGWVWQPDALPDGWRPYTYGHWEFTDYGWTWVSDYPWGWAAFHYGGWVVVDGRGWAWVPGKRWYPARVVWRYSDGYVGWAPVVYGYDYSLGWAVYPVVYTHWNFVAWHFFVHHHVYHHYVHHHRVHWHFHHSHYHDHYHGHGHGHGHGHCHYHWGGHCHDGPSREKVVQASGKQVHRMKLKRHRPPAARHRVTALPKQQDRPVRMTRTETRPPAGNRKLEARPSRDDAKRPMARANTKDKPRVRANRDGGDSGVRRVRPNLHRPRPSRTVTLGESASRSRRPPSSDVRRAPSRSRPAASRPAPSRRPPSSSSVRRAPRRSRPAASRPAPTRRPPQRSAVRPGPNRSRPAAEPRVSSRPSRGPSRIAPSSGGGSSRKAKRGGSKKSSSSKKDKKGGKSRGRSFRRR